MRRAPLFPILLAVLIPTVAAAELVQFKTGYSIEVDAYRIEGNKFIMVVGGGTVTVPRELIATVEDNELVTDLPGAPQRQRRPTRLDFKGGSRAPETPFGPLIHEVARRLRFNSALLAAIVEVESGFDPDRVSADGRRGLVQVHPERSFGVDPERLDEPEVNLEAAVRRLNWLRKRYRDDLDRVLAAYHFGREEVDRLGRAPDRPEVESYLEQVRQALAARQR